MTADKPTAIDLFCGCGGMTEGLKQAGYDVVWGVDIAEKPLLVYRLNHGDVSTLRGDIRDVDCRNLMDELSLRQGNLDMLAACPPCQGFSSIRTRNRSESVPDERNDLVHEVYRFARAFLPKAVMLENVPGLSRDSRFTTFVKEMENLGYKGEWKIVDVADSGVPQRRKRLIYASGLHAPVRIMNLELPRMTVRGAISSLPVPGGSGDELHDLPENRSARIRRLIAQIPHDGGGRHQLPDEYVLPCHRRNPSGFNDVYGRMAWDKPAPTITGGCASPSKGRFLHPEQNRCISLREAALLQGFPADYDFSVQTMAKHEIARMIGNALPAPFIRAHAESIMGELSPAKECCA